MLLFARAYVRICAILTVVASVLSSALVVQADADEPLQYNRDIRPILAEHCFACHGLDSVSREAGLRLDLRESAIESGAIAPHDPEASALIERVMTDDAASVMPPPESKKPLTQKQRAQLERWVSEGAEYEKHWALIAPSRPAVPVPANQSWPKNPIDNFVLRRLDQAKLTPAQEASPRILFRRLHLDITGLPPEPVDVDRFEEDYGAEPDIALAAWIDRLMATDAWGEHRGRYWLDAARYADTHGMHFDNYREMWPYRDWVIRSFNQNQPFDQFTIEQLAGDLLANPTLEQQIATGFQRCNMTTNEGGTIEAENLAIYAADRVQTFGWVYLGLTTNCCQCHDHKFDPLTMKDYYSLAAFFRNTTQTGFDGNNKNGKGPVIRVPSEADRDRWNSIDAEIEKAVAGREERRIAAEPAFRKWSGLIRADTLRNKIPASGLQLSLLLADGEGNAPAIVDNRDVERNAASTGELEWSIEGKFGPAIQFKPGHTVDVGSAANFALSQPFTHSEWIYTAKLNQSSSPLARMDEQNKHRGWDLFFANGQLAVHIIQSWPDNALKVTTRDKVIRNKTWHHVCVTWDGSGKPEGLSIYVDGEKRAVATNTNNLQANADIQTETPLRIGQRSHGAVFDGAVQELHVFDRLLDPSEIDALQKFELLARIVELPEDQRSQEQRAELLEHFLAHHDTQFSTLSDMVTALKQERANIESRSPVTHVQVERQDEQAMANILMRGQYDMVGDEVKAGVPETLHPLPANAPQNRLGLAQWVVAPENPLTARVTVNRFWQEIFGQGIVATPEDFGIMGAPPSHPDLLDWLAVDFVESGWDVKRFFKQILMSATYRQAAVTTAEKLEQDRDNSLLSRGPRFRMDAEMVRDYALTVSGLRSEKMFGPGVRPYQPSNIWNMVGLPGGDTREYRQDSGDDLYRRSLYTFWKRMAPPPSLEAFGAPNREVCTVRRERTNTPLQALVTLNDPQYVEAARKLAERSIHSGRDARSIVNSAAQRVLGRPLPDREAVVLLAAYGDFADYYAAHPQEALTLLKVGEADVDDSLAPSRLAAWTMVCNQIMNLDEALNK